MRGAKGFERYAFAAAERQSAFARHFLLAAVGANEHKGVRSPGSKARKSFILGIVLVDYSAIPSFFVAGNLQPQIRILIARYRLCGTGFCVAIIADEGASFQKPRFRSLDLTVKGQKVPKSGHF